MTFTKALLKDYIQAMGMGASYTALANVYIDEDEETHEDFNSVWIRELINPAHPIAFGEWQTEQWFELHLHHAQEDAWKRLRYLLMVYPRYYYFSDDCSTLTHGNWSITGIVVATGRFKATASTHYATLTIDDDTSRLSEMEFLVKMESSDVTKSIYTQLRKSDDTPILTLGITGSKVTYNGLELQAAVNDTEYTIRAVVDWSASTFDIYVDTVLKASDVAFLAAATSIDKVYIVGANACTGYWDDFIIRQGTDSALDAYRKPPDFPDPKFMGKDGHGQYHRRFTFQVVDWGVASE